MKISLPTDVTISKELLDDINAALLNGTQPKQYWDYRDEVSQKTVSEALDRNKEHPIDHIYDQLDSSDTIYELEIQYIIETLDDFTERLAEEFNCKEEDLDLKQVAHEIRDDVMESISVDMDVKSLLSKTGVNVRIEMYSNYDCINSDWLESQSPYSMDSYFGDMIRTLQFNPAEMKSFLISKGRQTTGNWPNRRKKKPFVSIEDFWTELLNSSCGANLLNFVGTMDAFELLTAGKKSTVTIGKGNNCGLFSSMYGGGSVMEMTLLRPITIDLEKKYDKSGYLNFGLHIDCDSGGYSMAQVYGVDASFFGGEISIKRNEKPLI